MKIETYLSERPATFPNYKYEPTPIPWPKTGKTIARCGDVFLIQETKHLFTVVYGLQVTSRVDRTAASREFAGCCLHQAQCMGLLAE